jgi:TonB family protein
LTRISVTLKPDRQSPIKKAKYTKEARDNNIEGVVVLNVVFTADGRIANIQVIKGLPHGLTDMAIEAAHKIRFNPAKRNGQPISVRGNIEYYFRL